MFFDSLSDLLRVVVVGTAGYCSLVLFLRISGKRTLAKMNAFDLVVTVALGSTLATMLLSSEVSLSEGMLALLLLIGLQYVVAWLSVRWKPFAGLVKSEPTLLVYRGELLGEALRRERVTDADVDSALRAAGLDAREQAEGLVLETDGSFSVVRRHSSASAGSSLLGSDQVEGGKRRTA